MTDYSSQFNQEVRKRLESLRGQIDEDLPKLLDLTLNLTFGQADELIGGIDSALNAYKGAMQPLYRTGRKNKTSGTGGTSYYQRRREQAQNITKLAEEAIEKQGYVVAAALAAQTGYRDGTVLKTLEQLASERGWERRHDRETKSPKYSPKPEPKQAEPGSS